MIAANAFSRSAANVLPADLDETSTDVACIGIEIVAAGMPVLRLP